MVAEEFGQLQLRNANKIGLRTEEIADFCWERKLWEQKASIFVRRCSGDSWPWIPFHTDTARVTLNVALSDEAEIEVRKDAFGGIKKPHEINIHFGVDLEVIVQIGFALENTNA